MRFHTYCLVLALSFQTVAMTLGQNILWFYNSGSASYFVDNVDFATTSNPWKPVVVDELKPFTVLRMMDADMTNRNPNVVWTDRRKKTDPYQYPTWNTEGHKGMAYEWMIQLCNLTGCHIWLCLPEKTISAAHKDKYSEYSLKLAILVKTGIDMHDIDLSSRIDRLAEMDADDFVTLGGVRTCEPLDPNLMVYTEWSNETWEADQNSYYTIEGGKLGLSAPKFHAFAALQVFKAFEKVFGPNNPRLFRVVAGQAKEPQRCTYHCELLNDPVWNPEGIKIQGYAIAPYFGGRQESMHRDSVLKGVADATFRCKQHNAIAKHYLGSDVQLIGYEGGQHYDKDTFNSNPDIYDYYKLYLDSISRYMDGVFCHYGYASAANWGSKAFPGQDDAVAHRYRALKEWAVDNNPHKPLTPTSVNAQPRLLPRDARMPVPGLTRTYSLSGRMLWPLSPSRTGDGFPSGVFVTVPAGAEHARFSIVR